MWTRDDVENKVVSCHVVVFGRGRPDAVLDGHSMRAIEILEAYGYPYEFVDITADASISNALVAYKQWTIPQIFIGGKLIGGSDSLLELPRLV